MTAVGANVAGEHRDEDGVPGEPGWRESWRCQRAEPTELESIATRTACRANPGGEHRDDNGVPGKPGWRHRDEDSAPGEPSWRASRRGRRAGRTGLASIETTTARRAGRAGEHRGEDCGPGKPDAMALERGQQDGEGRLRIETIPTLR